MVSQEYFDTIVNENIDEFGMSEDEAYHDAYMQVSKNVTDTTLKFLITTPQKLKISKRIESLMDDLNIVVKNVREGVSDTSINFDSLKELEQVIDSEFTAFHSIKQGLLGALIYLMEKISDDMLSLPMTIIMSIMKCVKCRDCFPAQGVEKVISIASLTSIEILGLKCIYQIIKGNEKNKQLFFDAKVDKLLRSSLVQTANCEKIHYCCAILRELVTDNDRRDGIHPNTFIRGRNLSEHTETSILNLLANIIKSNLENKSAKCDSEIFCTIKCLLVNNKACKIGLQLGLVDFANVILENSSNNIEVIECLTALGKSDDVKLEIGAAKSQLLLKIVDLLKNEDSTKLILACLKLLAAITLRQPDISTRLRSLGVIERCVDLMTIESSCGKIQKEIMSLLRNMVSSPESKHLVEYILNQGTETKIREAQQNFPKDCKDSSYALLRELGLKYC